MVRQSNKKKRINNMNTKIENDEPEDSDYAIASTFGELDINQYFSYLSEKYKKISTLRATNLDRNFDWMFPIDTEVNED